MKNISYSFVHRALVCFLAIVCCFLSTLKAQTTETTYVWAPSGLTLRATPDFKGAKLALLPYGTAVQITEYAQMDTSYGELSGTSIEPKVIELPTITSDGITVATVHGSWAKATFDGKTGYLFDAYLSTMQPLKGAEEAKFTAQALPTVEEGLAAMQIWVGTNYDLLRSTTKKGSYADAQESFIYDTGILFKKQGNDTFTWLIPDCSERDGYLIANYFFRFERKCSIPYPEGFDKPYRAGYLEFGFEGQSNSVLRIECHNETVFIIAEWGGC